MAQQEQCAPGDAWARIKSRLRAELGEDVFASTIQASMSGDSFLPDIDDDEIERSIREINEAIQRSGPRKT